MKVLFYGVGKENEVKEVKNKIKSLQELVHGYLECIYIEPYVIVVDEEAKLKETATPNRYLKNLRINLYNDFFVCRVKGPSFATITEADIETINEMFTTTF